MLPPSRQSQLTAATVSFLSLDHSVSNQQLNFEKKAFKKCSGARSTTFVFEVKSGVKIMFPKKLYRYLLFCFVFFKQSTVELSKVQKSRKQRTVSRWLTLAKVRCQTLRLAGKRCSALWTFKMILIFGWLFFLIVPICKNVKPIFRRPGRHHPTLLQKYRNLPLKRCLLFLAKPIQVGQAD